MVLIKKRCPSGETLYCGNNAVADCAAPHIWVQNRGTAALESHLNRQLYLSWISDARAKKAVEVEERWRRQRIDIVRVVERVEHLQSRADLGASADAEWSTDPPVEAEVRVVLAKRVSSPVDAALDARARRKRLRGPSLRAHVQFDFLRQFEIAEEVDLVPDVSIREGVIERQVREVERAIRERVALVRVVVFVA